MPRCRSPGKKHLPPWEHEFGCFANYLFEAGDEIKAKFKKELAIMQQKNTVTIGVHIRTGDHSFKMLEDVKNSNFGIGYDSHGIKMTSLLETMEKVRACPARRNGASAPARALRQTCFAPRMRAACRMRAVR